MEKAKEYVAEMSEKLGRPLTACVTTFGCQMVLATQNPIENEGTYPLPEAQLDRFLFKIPK